MREILLFQKRGNKSINEKHSLLIAVFNGNRNSYLMGIHRAAFIAIVKGIQYYAPIILLTNEHD